MQVCGGGVMVTCSWPLSSEDFSGVSSATRILCQCCRFLTSNTEGFCLFELPCSTTRPLQKLHTICVREPMRGRSEWRPLWPLWLPSLHGQRRAGASQHGGCAWRECTLCSRKGPWAVDLILSNQAVPVLTTLPWKSPPSSLPSC